MITRKKTLFYFIGAALVITCAVFFYRHADQTDHAGKVLVKVVVFDAPNGWGYDIMADQRIYIHQPAIPGLAGNKGFQTAAEAQRVGDLVLSRITANKLPTITRSDLNELKISQ